MFGFLLFVKSFHWLAADRIEWVCDRTLLAFGLTFRWIVDGPNALSWPTHPLSCPNAHTLFHPLGNGFDHVRAGGREHFGERGGRNGLVC